MLTGSAFALNRQTPRGGVLSVWGRAARSHFSGRDGALALNGDVYTTMLGTDYAKGPLVVGVSLSRSRGLGSYAGVAGGQVTSSVTGLYPWVGYPLSDRISVWGVTGYGWGALRLEPEGGAALKSDLSMAMAAAGTRGEIIGAGGTGGFGVGVQGGCAVGGHLDRWRGRIGWAFSGDQSVGDAFPDRTGRVRVVSCSVAACR